MLKLTIDPIVLKTLKKAMPKTNKAELALEKYVSVLEAHLNWSLLYSSTNLYKWAKRFVVSAHQVMAEGGQFVIAGKKQYLQDWLNQNKLALFEIAEVGLIGKEYSHINLTGLVKVTDELDLSTLGEQEINQIDQWLNDKSLGDEEFIGNVFPDIYTHTNIKQAYDYVEIDIVSLQRYIIWLIKKSAHFNPVEKQRMLRQAHLILRVAQITNGLFPQKKNHSFFGRNYYHGISVQSVHTSLREAMLGNCYEYDLRSAAASWKLGFAEDLLYFEGNSANLENEFGASLFYLQDKKAFTNYVINATFTDSSVSYQFKEGIIKQALTALSFGARMSTQGWTDASGKQTNPALVKIIKNKQERENFIHCDLIVSLMEEQKRLDDYIYRHFTETVCPDLLKETQLQTKSGRASKNKILAWLFQHAETHIMDMVASEVEKTNNEVLARVHDAIFVKHKISMYDKERIEDLICKHSRIKYWSLKEEEIKRYEGISDETLADEEAHRQHMAAEAELAKGYVGQFSQTS
jgi:hypothetical protein